MWIRQKIRWEYDRKSPAWITTKYGINTAVYVQSTVDKRPFTVILQLFTEHRKLSLGNMFEWLSIKFKPVSSIFKQHWTTYIENISWFFIGTWDRSSLKFKPFNHTSYTCFWLFIEEIYSSYLSSFTFSLDFFSIREKDGSHHIKITLDRSAHLLFTSSCVMKLCYCTTICLVYSQVISWFWIDPCKDQMIVWKSWPQYPGYFPDCLLSRNGKSSLWFVLWCGRTHEYEWQNYSRQMNIFNWY